MGDNHENVNTLLKEAGERVAGLVAATVDLYKKITWKRVVIEIPIVPEPSHRPRLSGYRVYVPGDKITSTWNVQEVYNKTM